MFRFYTSYYNIILKPWGCFTISAGRSVSFVRPNVVELLIPALKRGSMAMRAMLLSVAIRLQAEWCYHWQFHQKSNLIISFNWHLLSLWLFQRSVNSSSTAVSHLPNPCTPANEAEAHTSSSGTYFQSILGIFKYLTEVKPANWKCSRSGCKNSHWIWKL